MVSVTAGLAKAGYDARTNTVGVKVWGGVGVSAFGPAVAMHGATPWA